MDLPQREVAIDISEGIALPAPQLHDHQLQRARVRTFVVAVDEDRHRPRSPHMVVFFDGHRHNVVRQSGRRNASLSMFRLRIFHSSVWRGMPSFAAAPRGPATLPCVSCSAASINAFSPSARVVTAVPFDGLRCLRASHDSSITNVSPPPPPPPTPRPPPSLSGPPPPRPARRGPWPPPGLALRYAGVSSPPLFR